MKPCHACRLDTFRLLLNGCYVALKYFAQFDPSFLGKGELRNVTEDNLCLDDFPQLSVIRLYLRLLLFAPLTSIGRSKSVLGCGDYDESFHLFFIDHALYLAPFRRILGGIPDPLVTESRFAD